MRPSWRAARSSSLTSRCFARSHTEYAESPSSAALLHHDFSSDTPLPVSLCLSSPSLAEICVYFFKDVFIFCGGAPYQLKNCAGVPQLVHSGVVHKPTERGMLCK